MFTGIIQTTGIIKLLDAALPNAADIRLRVSADGNRLGAIQSGDSVAVNGVCLTASSVEGATFVADVSAETISCTTMGALKNGARVNLETAVTPATALGGHLVSGHVDGVGEVARRTEDARSVRFQIHAPEPLAKFIATKGSITVDGVSLTVNEVSGASFEVNIVPHTLDVTVLGDYRAGDAVNLEVDLIARYLERLLHYNGGGG